MKKQLIFLSFLFFTLVGTAQDATNSLLNINKGVAIIDGQNTAFEAFTCNSSETSWAATYKNIADTENIRIFYYKTTPDNCVITFPDSTLIPQANGRDGVTVSGKQATLVSSSKGFFIIIVVKDGAAYKVSCTRITD